MMDNLQAKIKARLNRKIHIRKRVSGTSERPRVCLFRSNKRIYVQVIDDVSGKTIAAASSLEAAFAALKPNVDCGKKVGEALGVRLKEKKISMVVFDRSGYKYHGVVRAVADAVRGAGIQF
ncbi:MAG: 50S ribosomal protein L18 [Spirochaetia bacterium]